MASREDNIKGYPRELFLEDIPDRYLCTLCGLVARNVQVVNCCEKRFCRSCVKPSHDKHQACPHCNDQDFEIMSMKKDNLKINELNVCCRERNRGCQWRGKLKDLQFHLTMEEDGCRYSPMECSRCHELVNRCDMVNHQENECIEREYRCMFCNYEASYDHVTRAHMPECSYCPLKCPNQCGVTCERMNMDEHLQEICPEQYLPCEYTYAGCEIKYRRKNKDDHMTEHMNDHKMMEQIHKQVTVVMKKFKEEMEATEKERQREICELKNEIDQLKQQLVQLRQESRHHLDQHISHEEHSIVDKDNSCRKSQFSQASPSHVFALAISEPWQIMVDKFTERLEQKDRQLLWESEVAQTPFGFRLQLHVWPSGKKEGEGTHMTVWLGYILSEGYIIPSFPTSITMKLELIDHQGRRELLRTENFRIEQVGKYKFNYIGTFNNNQLISHERLHRQKLIQNDSIVMYVTLLEERLLCHNETGAAGDSLANYFDSRLEDNFLEQYNPQD